MTARRIPVDGGVLAVVDEGSGEAVLAIGGAVHADAFAPLFAQPAFTSGRRVVRYQRRGFGRSTAPPAASIERESADVLAILDALGIDRVHLVGWSGGGVIAIQVALDRPGAVASVTLLEPALMVVPAAADLQAALGPAFAAWAGGDVAGALDRFCAAVDQPDWRARSEEVLPGSVAQAEWDAAVLFESDLPGVASAVPTAERIREITAPVLLVTGESSGPMFTQVRDWVVDRLPQTENATMAGNHSFPFTGASLLAVPLAAFLDRHVMAPDSMARQPA